jgi:hypothetical protein
MTMTTSVAAADWIKRIADDERRRDAVRASEAARASRKAELVLLNGGRLLEELRGVIARDVEAFREEFAGDLSHEILLDVTDDPCSFVVRKPMAPAVTLTASPQLEAGTMDCTYLFTSTGGLPPREERVHLAFAADGAETLQIRTRTGQVFAGADALSEYLLGPVFTGRPR